MRATLLRWCHLVNAYGVKSLVQLIAAGGFLPVLNLIQYLAAVHAGTCAVLRGSLLIVCNSVRLPCCIKRLLLLLPLLLLFGHTAG